MDQPITTTDGVSIAVELEQQANAISPRRFRAPTKDQPSCRHLKTAGEATERVKRWVTLFERLRAEHEKKYARDRAWAHVLAADCAADAKLPTEKQLAELKRRDGAVMDRMRILGLVKMLAQEEIHRAFPDIPAGADTAVNSDWTVVYADHSPQAMFDEFMGGDGMDILGELLRGGRHHRRHEGTERVYGGH